MSYENRSTWIYFLLSAFVGLCIFILLFFSMQTVVFEQRRDILKRAQKSLKFIKPVATNKQYPAGADIYYNKWQIIGDPNLRHQQYSAYFDPRTEILNSADYDEDNNSYGSVRIFGIFPLKFQSEMFCIFKFENNITKNVKATELLPIHEHHGMPFSGYTVMCPMINSGNPETVRLPQSVALSYPENPPTLLSSPTYISISYSKGDVLEEPTRNLAVCVGPLPNNFNGALRLVEFIEMYSILGAEKFYFYEQTTNNITKNITEILEYYEKIGLVQVLNWNLPNTPHQFNDTHHQHQIHYDGIMVKLNDCVYRATFIDGFEYIAIVNVDEILIPMEYNTLVDLIDELEDHRTSAFNFRGVYFHRNYKNDYFTRPAHIKNQFLYTQTIVERTENPFAVHQRSKYIVRARAAIEMGTNQIWRALDGHSETTIKSDMALLYNYRSKCVMSSCDAALMLDFTARKYGSLIWNRVENVCGQVFQGTNGICPL